MRICLFTHCLDLAMRPYSFPSLPFSGPHIPLLGIVVYLTIIFALQRLMKNRRPLALRPVAAVHNVFLAALSAAMCLGTLVELGLRIRHQGFFSVVCDRGGTAMRGRLAMWLYIFYLSKYYELFDTVILVLKKRRLNFLHVYHHCVVMPLFWLYMATGMVIHWVLVVANSLVHVLMYYYYAAASCGKTVPWKRYITLAQIAQFVVDLTATWPFPFLYFSAQGCSGSMPAWVFGQAVGASFTYLFAKFYAASYSPRDAWPQQRREKMT